MLALPRWLWVLIFVGIGIRVVLAFAFVGDEFDIESFQIVQRELKTADPLEVYTNVNPESTAGDATVLRYPYPPGFMGWIAVVALAENVTGLPFHGLLHLLPIACDIGLALAVFIFLGWRTAAMRTRIAAAGLILLGPSFIAVSGYAGQLDSIAILPAVLAMMAFYRLDGPRKEIVSGLLVGLGTAVKWVPGFLVLAFLPALRSRLAWIRLGVASAAIPVMVVAPFLIADTDGFLRAIDYAGAPGLGGLGLVVQPNLIQAWFGGDTFSFNAASDFLYENASRVTLAGLLAATILLIRNRPDPIDAAVFLWVVVYAVAPNYFPQYLVWGLPFLLMAGYVRQVLLFQIAVLIPTILVYTKPHDELWVQYAYVATMLLIWVGWVAAAWLLGRRIVRGRPQPGNRQARPIVRFDADERRLPARLGSVFG